MIKIDKSAANEPRSWVEYRDTPGATYQATADLRNALLREQGYICAYCMRGIPLRKKEFNLVETSKIEHIKSRRHYEDQQLNYGNMVICCPGFIDGNDHCDKSKDHADISFSPFDPNVQMSITYRSKDGTIKSSVEAWEKDINQILCLNNNTLKSNRANVLKGIVLALDRKKWRKAELESQLDEWKKPNKEGRLNPYCGIVIKFLEKKLK